MPSKNFEKTITRKEKVEGEYPKGKNRSKKGKKLTRGRPVRISKEERSIVGEVHNTQNTPVLETKPKEPIESKASSVKTSRARIETSGDGTMKKYYDESGTFFKEVGENYVDYIHTEGLLKGKLKEKKVSLPDRTNFYSGTGVLIKSILKDGTVIQTPAKPYDTPTEAIQISDKKTTLLQGNASAITEQTPTESASWKEVQKSTQGNPDNWDDIIKANDERISKSAKEPSTVEEDSSSQTQIMGNSEPTQIMPTVEQPKHPADGDWINPVTGNKESFFDGNISERYFPDGRIQYFVHGKMFKEELPTKKSRTTKTETTVVPKTKEPLMRLNTYVKPEGGLRTLPKNVEENTSATTQPMPTEEIKELSLADKIIETVPAAYKEATTTEKSITDLEKEYEERKKKYDEKVLKLEDRIQKIKIGISLLEEANDNAEENESPTEIPLMDNLSPEEVKIVEEEMKTSTPLPFEADEVKTKSNTFLGNTISKSAGGMVNLSKKMLSIVKKIRGSTLLGVAVLSMGMNVGDSKGVSKFNLDLKNTKEISLLGNDVILEQLLGNKITNFNLETYKQLSSNSRLIYLHALRNVDSDFVIVDKPKAEMCVIGKNKKLIAKFPILLGKTKGEGKNTFTVGAEISGEKATTPSGIYKIGHEKIEEKIGKENLAYYKGKIFSIYNSDSLAIHMTYPKEYKERKKALDTPTIEDNRMSGGCVNVDEATFDKYLKNLSENTILFITPDDENIVLNPITGKLEMVNNDLKLLTKSIVSKILLDKTKTT